MDPPPELAVAKTDRRTEWEILDSLTKYGRVAIPAARCFDASGDVFGKAMMVSDFVPSTMLVAALRNTSKSEFGGYAEKLATLAASIHNVDTLAVPSLKLPPSWDAYIDERIEEWRDIEREFYASDPFIRYIATWLDKNRPAAAPLSLVHGDFHAGNSIVAENGNLLAVDWEFTHIGDPREDLGRLLMMGSIMPPDLLTAEFDVFLRRYRAETKLGEDIINKESVIYFQLMSGAMPLREVLRQTSALARGEVANHTLLYVTGVHVLQHELWLNKTRSLQAALVRGG
jgi:aminoglycoside phosphotransferase (APT) family kinase protein